VKIVHVEDCFLPTSGYQLNFLAKWNVIHGHEVTVIASDSLAPWTNVGFCTEQLEEMDRDYESKFGVKILRVHSYRRISGREFIGKKLFEIVDAEKPDIVMVHGFDTLTGLRFIWKLGKLKYPMISDCHMYPVASKNHFAKLFKSYVKTFITPRIEKYRLKIAAISTATKHFMINSYSIPEYLIPIIPFGTDTDLFKPDKEQRKIARKNLGIPENSFVIVYTGKITKDKKVVLLAKAFKQHIQQNHEKTSYLIMVGSGSGEYYDNVVKTLAPVKAHVRFVPTQKVWNLPQYYQAADIAVWPGACSLSFFDAQACGLPVIAENIAGNDERLSYNNGWLFESDNVEDLCKKIEHAATLSSAELAEIGERGRHKVMETQSYDKIARDFEELMKSEIKRFEFEINRRLQ